MAKITYRNIHKHDGAWTTTFHGVDFEHNVPVDVHDDEHHGLIAMAKTNPWFKVEDEAQAEAAGDAGSGEATGAAPASKPDPAAKTGNAYTRGREAAEKGTSVTQIPPGYRGKPQAEQWVMGHNDWSAEFGAPPPTQQERELAADKEATRLREMEEQG